MERRKFLKDLSILGTTVMVLPNIAFAKTQEVCLLPIQTQTQIRHGLFSLTMPLVETKDWYSSIQKNIFYKNGYTAGLNDLTLYSFAKNGEDYLLGIKQEELLLTVNGLTTKHSLKENQVLYQNKEEALELKLHQGELKLMSNLTYLFLPINTTTHVDNYYLDGQVLKVSNSNKVVSIDKQAIIIITKN